MPLLDIAVIFQLGLDVNEDNTYWVIGINVYDGKHREAMGDYPAANSMSFLVGDFPLPVDTTIETDTQRKTLFKDPFAAFGT